MMFLLVLCILSLQLFPQQQQLSPSRSEINIGKLADKSITSHTRSSACILLIPRLDTGSSMITSFKSTKPQICPEIIFGDFYLQLFLHSQRLCYTFLSICSTWSRIPDSYIFILKSKSKKKSLKYLGQHIRCNIIEGTLSVDHMSYSAWKQQV